MHNTVLYYTALHYTWPYLIRLHNTALHCTELYCICNVVLWSTLCGCIWVQMLKTTVLVLHFGDHRTSNNSCCRPFSIEYHHFIYCTGIKCLKLEKIRSYVAPWPDKSLKIGSKTNDQIYLPPLLSCTNILKTSQLSIRYKCLKRNWSSSFYTPV